MKNEGFITEEGFQQLRKYKYQSGGFTWIDTKMNYFWEWCARQLPTWMAPNLITFIGWIFVIMSYANILWYDYTFQKDIPASCFFFAAACTFIYMTLDAIDGKQARNTKSSSPLGQLFDHGCDSFSVTFFILGIGQAVRMPKQEIFLVFVATQLSFWTANWMEYNTGILKTHIGQFGVTESQFTVIVIHLLTGVFGQSWWHITMDSVVPSMLVETANIPGQFLELRVGTVVLYGYVSLFLLMCSYSYLSTIWKSTGQRYKAMAEFFSLYVIIAMELIWIHLQIYEEYVGLILVNFGLLASLLTCKLIICSVTHMKFDYFHNELVLFMLTTILMIYFDLREDLASEIILFWTCFALNVISSLRFLYLAINQLTKFLGIYCFSLQKRKAE